MTQSVDRYGAADHLKLTAAQVSYRIRNGKFPKPDAVENDIEWWDINTLDKYQRSLTRKKRTTRKR